MLRAAFRPVLPCQFFAACVAWAVLWPGSAPAYDVWSGLTKFFDKKTFSDYTDPDNQDFLTENAILTRGDFGGLINYAEEFSYIHQMSPLDTEWATDINNPDATISAENGPNLEFTNWIDAYGGPFSAGSEIPGTPAVLHLITDDIYIDIQFDSWETGQGGGYSYWRGQPLMTPETTGDYNEDGFVDAADYVLWRATLDDPAVPAGSGADGDADGTIGAGDYTYWAARFGNTIPGTGGGSSAIPEPATGLVAALTLAGWATLLRKSRALG